MNKPKMILFDYGGTLMSEPDFDPASGNVAIYPYICQNPHNISLEEFGAYLLQLFDEIKALRGDLIEIHEHIFMKNVLEHFDMKLSVPLEEAEYITWNGISAPRQTPGAADMLAFLRNNNIRTGVISNLCWSGVVLTRRLTEGFTEHNFEFILASSEYIFRKPDPHMFEMAHRKSGLEKDEIWYVGNDMAADVVGAGSFGFHPVLYDDRSVPHNLFERNEKIKPDFPYSYVRNWIEFTELLGNVKLTTDDLTKLFDTEFKYDFINETAEITNMKK